jgi:hypothetical protein
MYLQLNAIRDGGDQKEETELRIKNALRFQASD